MKSETAKQRMKARNLARRKAHYRREKVNHAGVVLFWLGILLIRMLSKVAASVAKGLGNRPLKQSQAGETMTAKQRRSYYELG